MSSGGRKGASILCSIFVAVLSSLSCGSRPGSIGPRPVTFEPVTFDQWQRELASLKGEIVVVDLWATWCEPCIERFPHMVQLYNRYKDAGVTFVSISVDDREDKQALETARQFLRRQNATFRNYLMNENISQSFEKLDIEGVPDVFVYDPAGRRRYALNGNDPNRQFTEKDVDDAVATLVAER
jgi:thiol-disulfide isomerase/thioredoxin